MRRNLLKLGRVIPIVILSMVIGAVCLSYYRSTRTAGTPEVQAVRSLPEEVTDLTEGFSVFHSEQGQTTIEVRAKVRLGLRGEKSRLEQVKAKVYRKDGDHYDTIASRRCEVDHVSGDVVFLEDVVVTLGTPKGSGSQSVPSILKAESMKYSRSSAQVTTDAPVSLERGRIRGSSRGLVYDSRGDLIHLPSQVEVKVLPPLEGGHTLRIKADSLKCRTRGGEVELRSNVRVNKGPTELTAALLRAVFTTPDWILSHIEAEGDVRSKSLDPGAMIAVQADYLSYLFAARPGSLDKVVARGNVLARPLTSRSVREMSAQEMTLVFPAQSQSIQSLTAVGEARVLFLASDPSEAGTQPGTIDRFRAEKVTARRILTSPHLRAYFQPGTSRLSQVEARGPSTLEELPFGPSEAKRTLSAKSFRLFYGESSDHLERFAAHRDVQMKFTSASGTVRETRSDHLTALFDRQTNQVSELRQTGGFTYREPGRQARAETATHLVDQSLIKLAGRPQVSDDQSKTEADAIEFHRARHLVKAEGDVRSTYYGSGTEPASERAIYASAEFMEFHTRKGIVRYWKNAKLWQKDQMLYAQDIRLNRAARRMVASGRVTSLFHNSAEEEPSRRTMVQAEKMTYEEQAQKILYENRVSTTASQGSLQSDRLHIYLKRQQGETSVERVLAEGNVKMTQPNRTSFSQWAEYFGQERKVVLWGGSPQVVDYERGFTTGARLTIDMSGDSVAVEGNAENRAVTTQRLSR